MPHADILILLLEIGWPLTVFVLGGLLMHRSGMLPQQKRLDELLKDVIKGQDEQLKLRDSIIGTLEARTADLEAGALAAARAALEALAAKDQTLAALERALVREQQETTTLRAQVADNQLKLNAMVAHQQRANGGEVRHGR